MHNLHNVGQCRPLVQLPLSPPAGGVDIDRRAPLRGTPKRFCAHERGDHLYRDAFKFTVLLFRLTHDNVILHIVCRLLGNITELIFGKRMGRNPL